MRVSANTETPWKFCRLSGFRVIYRQRMQLGQFKALRILDTVIAAIRMAVMSPTVTGPLLLTGSGAASVSQITSRDLLSGAVPHSSLDDATPLRRQPSRLLHLQDAAKGCESEDFWSSFRWPFKVAVSSTQPSTKAPCSTGILAFSLRYFSIHARHSLKHEIMNGSLASMKPSKIISAKISVA
ncbi:hypothetical protein KC366_g10 [Hortaea werneckii]|nr:hypothetical protein KC366_g10 [Hortaea werneckii]